MQISLSLRLAIKIVQSITSIRMDIKAGPIGFPLLVRNYPNKCIQKKDRQVKKKYKK